MDANRRNLRTVGLAFGATGALSSLTWAVVGMWMEPQGAQHVPLGLIIVVSTVLSAIVGSIAWTLIVDSFERWSTPARGAIAGAVMVWWSLPAVVTVMRLINPPLSALSVEVLLEALVLAVFMGTVGMVFVGVFFLPFGIITGYILGRRLAKNPGPVPVVHRIA